MRSTIELDREIEDEVEWELIVEWKRVNAFKDLGLECGTTPIPSEYGSGKGGKGKISHLLRKRKSPQSLTLV